MKTAAPCCLGGALLAKGPSADIHSAAQPAKLDDASRDRTLTKEA